jgi:hypothetical protein
VTMLVPKLVVRSCNKMVLLLRSESADSAARLEATGEGSQQLFPAAPRTYRSDASTDRVWYQLSDSSRDTRLGGVRTESTGDNPRYPGCNVGDRMVREVVAKIVGALEENGRA